MFQVKVVNKIKTRIIYVQKLFFDNPAVYEIMWKYISKPGRVQMTMPHAHCMLDY
jgi:hypothetical protein